MQIVRYWSLVLTFPVQRQESWCAMVIRTGLITELVDRHGIETELDGIAC
jgi:hypothetical protein